MFIWSLEFDYWNFMRIYTRTGDKGETSLFGGTRVLKSSIRVEAYGAVDELNSAIGVSVAETKNIKLKTRLINIQSDLFEVGSALANPNKSKVNNLEERVKDFEVMIDEMMKVLPELRNFILPGGGIVGSQLHLVRSIARRAERRVVELSQKEEVDKSILMYFNRLSDLLFTMARYINNKEKRKEVIWKNK